MPKGTGTYGSKVGRPPKKKGKPKNTKKPLTKSGPKSNFDKKAVKNRVMAYGGGMQKAKPC